MHSHGPSCTLPLCPPVNAIRVLGKRGASARASTHILPLCILLSGSEGTHTAVVQEVQAKAVAVDLSAWVVQAICQPDLAQAFNDPDSQALSVSFNRVSAGTW